MAHVAFTGVRKAFDRTEVLHGIDLEIAEGEFLVILGPSGCGKSTLLRLLAGLEELTAGDIAIDGKVVNKLEPRERGCAMVFQNYALYPHMSVADNIGYSLKVAGIAKRARREKIEAVAAVLGLGEFLDRKPGQLSGGQRQRVAMGRAIIREPKVFLFDEPLSNLDAKLRVQMRLEIRQLHRRLKTTSMFVTHDQVEAMTLADRLVVMRDGVIEQVGTPQEIYDRPATRFVGDFIGAPPMNFLPARLNGKGPCAELTDGQTVELPAPIAERLVGREILIGLRAEDVTLDGGASHSLVFAPGFHEELGAGRLLHGQIAGSQFIVATDKHQGAANDAGTVRFTTDKLHVFDAASGLRVG